MTEEPEYGADDVEDVDLADEGVEDLEPEGDEADDVAGGKHIGNVKYNDFPLS